MRQRRSASPWIRLVAGSCLLFGVSANALDVSGPIVTDTTWGVGDSPVRVQADVTVESGAHLRIDSGVVVRFSAGARLIVRNGSLEARGTSAQSIRFESGEASPAAGDWGPLVFEAGSDDSRSLLDRVQVSHGKGLRVQGAAPALSNMHFEHNQGAAMQIDLASSPAGSGLTAVLNDINGILVPAGTIDAEIRWGLVGIPYVVEQGIVEVGRPGILLTPATMQLREGESGQFTVRLAEAAPAGGLSLGLQVDAPTVLQAPATVHFLEGQVETTFTVQALAFGSTRLTLSHPQLGTEVANVSVLRQLRIILDRTDVYLAPGAAGSLAVRLSEPAAAPGVVVSLVSSNPTVASIQPTIEFPTGGGSFEYAEVQGYLPGDSIISVTAPGYLGASATVHVRDPALSFGQTGPIYTGLESPLLVEFSLPTDSKGVWVELLNDNPAVLEVPDGFQTGPYALSTETIVFGLAPGTATVEATANGYAPAQIDLQVVEFSLSFDPPVSPVIPSGSSQAFTVYSNLPAPFDLRLYLESADPGVATPDGESILIPAGLTTATTPLVVWAQAESGSTLIRLRASTERPTLAELEVSVGPALDSRPNGPYAGRTAAGAAAASLEMADGVVVKFGAAAGINVYRGIRSDGIVVLSSVRDHSIGGVTLPGGGSPQPGDWRGVWIDLDTPVDAVALAGFELRYASVGLQLAGPHHVQGVYVHHAQTGLAVGEGSGSRLSDSRLDQNSIGFLADTHSNLRIDASSVSHNTVRGGENRTPARVVDARGNWWGHPSGPRDPVANPIGQGNPVTTGIDYGSFLNQPVLAACRVFAVDHQYQVVLRSVRLRLACPTATQYRVSEFPDLGGAQWQAIAATVPFMLSPNPGSKTVYAELSNGQGQSRIVATPQPFVLDPSIPQVAFTAPPEGAALEGDTWLRIQASDPAGIASAEFRANGEWLGTDTVAPYEWFWQVGSLPDGHFELTATVINGEGRAATIQRAVTVLRMRPEPDAYVFDEGDLLYVPPPGVLANDLLLSSGQPELVSPPEWGNLDVHADGSFSFDPGNPDQHGITSFRYRLRNGGLASAAADVTLTVRSVNDAPKAFADSYQTDENVQIVVPAPGLLANDSDVESPVLLARLARPPQHGQAQVSESGAFSYVPAVNYRGLDTFEYTVLDEHSASATSVVTIHVTQPPTGTNDLYLVDLDTPLEISDADFGWLANDHDAPENDPLTVTVTRLPDHGTLTWNPNGTFRYVPDPGFSGLDLVRYQCSDGRSNSNTATVTLAVDITSLPVAVGDAYTFNEDEELVVPAQQGLLANDRDADTPPAELRATVTGISEYGIEAGSLEVAEDGSFRVRAPQNSYGETFFLYRIFDGSNISNEAIVALTVLPVNDGVVAEDDHFGVLRNGVFQAGVGVYYNQSIEGNDEYDPDFDVDYELVQPPAHGSAILDPETGALTYTPPTEFSGITELVYRAFQPDTGISDTATVTFRTNGPPVALDDHYVVDEDASSMLAVHPLANDSDPENDPLSVIGFGAYQGLCDYSLSIDFDPVAPQIHASNDYYGTCELRYALSDGLLSAVGRIFVTVLPSPDDPMASSDHYYVQQNGSLQVSHPAEGILGNDQDPDSRYPWASGPDLLPLRPDLLSDTANGTLALEPDGTFEYTPAAGYSGLDSFTYRVVDGTNRASGPATVTIRVNSPPQPMGDEFVVLEDSVLVVPAPGLLANDLDPDNDDLSIGFGFPANGCMACRGELLLHPDGGFRYLPGPNYFGSDEFNYFAVDFMSGADAHVTITVLPVNDAPVTEPDTYRTAEDTPLVVAAAQGVLRNDREVDGEALTNAELVSPPNHGSVAVANQGAFSYTPVANFHGSDGFRYRVYDESGLHTVEDVSITIDAVNDAPVANSDTYSIRKDLVLDVGSVEGVLANDSDADGDPLSASAVGLPVHGQLLLRANGSLVYQPNGQFVGTDTFQYQIADGLGGVAAGTVAIQVLDTIAPVLISANDDQFVLVGQQLTVAAPGVLANDTVSGAAGLTAATVVPPSVGTLAMQPDGGFSYTAPPGYLGVVSFSYSANAAGQAELALVTLDVRNAPNQAPTATGEQFGLIEDGRVDSRSSGSLLVNDHDPEGGSLALQLTQGTTHGTLTVEQDGEFSYQPEPDFHGTDSLRYRVSDSELLSNEVIAEFTVFARNDAPTALDDVYQVLRDDTLSVTSAAGVLANDTDVDGDPLVVEMHDAPLHGQLTVNTDGSFQYSTAPAFTGLDRFRYAVSDGRLRVLASVTINVVAPGNQAPVAVGETLQLEEDGQIGSDSAGLLTANDSDPDGDPLFVVLQSPPQHGLLTLDGAAFTYRPAADFSGSDQFQYRVTDGALSSNLVAVAIQVLAVNDAPRTRSDLYAVAQGQTLTVGSTEGVLANDSDVEGDDISAGLLSNPAHGSVQLSANGAFNYQPSAGFHGRDEFGYRASDGVAESPGRAIIDVTQAANQRPIAIGETFAIAEDAVLDTRQLQSLLANDTDADGQPLALVILSQPPRGVLEELPAGHVRYTPARDDHGNIEFDYTVSDGELQAEQVQVRIQLLPQPDAPQAQPDLYSLAPGEPALVVGPTMGVLANDIEPDGEVLVATLLQAPTAGAINLGLDGGFTYSPPSLRPPSVEFDYRVSDPGGLSAQSSARILLGGTPPPDAIFAVGFEDVNR